ncbi:MAG: hypothetical protein AB1782_10755 [Cyanobacteriota bacterium]
MSSKSNYNKYEQLSPKTNSLLLQYEETIDKLQKRLQHIQGVVKHKDQQLMDFVKEKNKWKSECKIFRDKYVNLETRIKESMANVNASIILNFCPDCEQYFTIDKLSCDLCGSMTTIESQSFTDDDIIIILNEY